MSVATLDCGNLAALRCLLRSGKPIAASVFADKYGRYAKDPSLVAFVIVTFEDAEVQVTYDQFKTLTTAEKEAIAQNPHYLAPPNTEDSNA